MSCQDETWWCCCFTMLNRTKAASPFIARISQKVDVSLFFLPLWPKWSAQHHFNPLSSAWVSILKRHEEIISGWSKAHCWFFFPLPSSFTCFLHIYAIICYPACIYPRLHLISLHKEKNIPIGGGNKWLSFQSSSVKKTSAFQRINVEILIWEGQINADFFLFTSL